MPKGGPRRFVCAHHTAHQSSPSGLRVQLPHTAPLPVFRNLCFVQVQLSVGVPSAESAGSPFRDSCSDWPACSPLVVAETGRRPQWPEELSSPRFWVCQPGPRRNTAYAHRYWGEHGLEGGVSFGVVWGRLFLQLETLAL